MNKKIIFWISLNLSLIVVIISLFIIIDRREKAYLNRENIESQTKDYNADQNNLNQKSNLEVADGNTNDHKIGITKSDKGQSGVDKRTDTKESSDNKNILNSDMDKNNIDGEIDNTNNTKNPSKKDIELVFAGDFYLSNYVLTKYNKHGINGVLSIFLQNQFKRANIAMVNEEFPFSKRGTPMKDKQFTFRIDPKYVSLFQNIGLDIVTLANNHTLDYGLDALTDSLTTLSDVSIQYVGAGNNLEEAKAIREFEVNDKRIAVLAASRVIPETNWNATNSKPGLLTTYDPTTLLAQIKTAKENNDIIVVYVHWGIERKTKPEAYQRALAKRYIDAGADLVIGSHPHVLQGIEFYKNKPIVYSLGNFMFYNSIDKTALIKITINSSNQPKITIIPCRANNALTSELKTKKERNEFYDYYKSISYNISIDHDGNVSNLGSN